MERVGKRQKVRSQAETVEKKYLETESEQIYDTCF